MNYERKHYAAGGGLVLAALLLAGDGPLPTDLAEAQERIEENAGSVIDRVQEVSSDGELVVDPVSGVFYDDPEEGDLDDEEGDDRNVSFDDVNDALASIGEYIDPTTYAPDTQDGSVAPDSGVLPDAGDSQNWGDAPEAEDDDLTERTATSNMTDDQKSMWDRFANQDTTSDSDSDSDSGSTSDSSTSDSSTDDDLGGLESGSSYDRWDSGSSSSGSSTSDDDDDDDGGYTISLPDSLTQSESEDLTGDYSGGYVV